jgi:hypothetical protein
MSSHSISRRAVIGGLSAAPLVITSRALGGNGVPPASDRIAIAFIGVGTRGGDGLVKHFTKLPECQCVATCDPFKDRREHWASYIDGVYGERDGKASHKSCATYSDLRELLRRKDIDAVAIATPDHWHVPAAIAAVKAGKDIYVEKPLGLTVQQNLALRKAVNKHKRIFQYGTQQRSMPHLLHGCELVRNGRIGKVHTVEVIAPAGSPGGVKTPMPVPEGFDYDLWLGPAPVAPYTKDRCIGYGRYFIYDYSIGYLGGWGAHPLDIMQWGLGTDETTPVEYEGTGVIPKEGLFDAVTTWEMQCRYASGVQVKFNSGPIDLTKFIGPDGWIALSREKARSEAHPKSLFTPEIKAGELRLHNSANHYQDFLTSIKSRNPTVNPIESAVSSDAISQLSDIAIRTGRKIAWDPVKERIVGDAEAARMLARPLRKPWQL